MKKIFLILFFAFIATETFALSEKEIKKLASKAYTKQAVNYIWGYCEGEDAFLQVMYSKPCKCAIKMGKGRNRNAALAIWEDCTDGRY